MTQRLRRLDWVYSRFPIFFVTACTARRRSLFACAAVHKCLIEYGEAGPARGAWLGAYVLMPDHLHRFVALDGERFQLSDWVKSLKNALSKRLRDMGVASPHWQKGFFDHVLRSEESYEEKWNYVRDNPVRADLAAGWQEWPYYGEIFDLRYR